MYDEELERFKIEINLVELASSYGYESIRKESSRSSIAMVHSDGDKVVIATGLDGHGIFFSVRETGGGGSVIDFVMRRENVQLGRARQALRKCLVPGYLDAHSKVHYRPEPICEATSDLYVQWLRMSSYGQTSGYLQMRGLNAETIAAFADRIRVDGRGNVAFRHDDLRSFTGWELKNRGFTGFTAGGKKALFGCKIGLDKTVAPLLVVAESAIDAMSYYQMQPRPGFYLSFAGGISRDQYELLAWIVNRYANAEVIAATDNDAQGDKYVEQIRQLRSDVVRDCPPIGKDWNDALNNRQALEKK